MQIRLLDKQYIEEGSKTALMNYGVKGKKYWLDMLKDDLHICKGMRSTKDGIEFDSRLLDCQPFMEILDRLNSESPYCVIHPEQ